ncbi:MerR family transcriptional regulator [Streptomyces sp. NPDC091292]|uniref:MerR family transcriptional regulator n=1 Tax=Streptomyces sp. NPDC091292 TaxID=3365991 RepID=UPI003830F617
MTVMETVTQTKAAPAGTTTGARPRPGASRSGASRSGQARSEQARSGQDVCAAGPAAHPRPQGQDQYTISEVVAFTGLTAHTLRWYERIGLMPHVDRSHTGQRRYTNRDLDWLDFVGKLRLTGMPVADMVRYAELVRAGEDTFAERRDLLEDTRRDVLTRIAELQDTLAVLDHKITFYADSSTERTATR